MINTQLHNQLIELEIQRKTQEAKKRVQEAKTQILKERLRQASYIVGFIFVILLLVILLLWLLPNRFTNSLALNNAKIQKENHNILKRNKIKKKESKKKEGEPFSGTEYVKENNFVYKRVYKEGIMVLEEKLAPTITESKKQNHEKIPQFSMPKKKNASN